MMPGRAVAESDEIYERYLARAIKAINGAAILLFRDPAVRDRLGTEDV